MTTTQRAYTDETLPQLLTLIEGADSVELKVTVAEHEQAKAVDALGLDPLDAQIRQVYFFDTPDLALNRAGVVVRARRVQAKGDDTVIKLRPVMPHELPKSLRRLPGFVVEVDMMPGGFVCSGTMKRVLTKPVVHEAIAGERPVRKLFSKDQRAFFASHAPEGLSLDELAILGPVFVLKARMTPPELSRKIVTEVWFYPDGSRILELSTKCSPQETFATIAEVRAFLGDRGVDTSGEQHTKTKQALEFFSQEV